MDSKTGESIEMIAVKYKPFVNIRTVAIQLQSTASILKCLVDEFLLSFLVSRCLQLRLEICCF